MIAVWERVKEHLKDSHYVILCEDVFNVMPSSFIVRSIGIGSC